MTTREEARELLTRIADGLEDGRLRWIHKQLHSHNERGWADGWCAVGLVQKEVSLQTVFGQAVMPSAVRRGTHYTVGSAEGRRSLDHKVAVAAEALRLLTLAIPVDVMPSEREGRSGTLIEAAEWWVIRYNDVHCASDSSRVLPWFRRAATL